MTFLFHGFEVAFFVTLVALGFSLIRNKCVERSLIAAGSCLVVIGLLNTWFFWMWHPIIGISVTSYYKAWGVWMFELLLAIFVIGIFGSEWEYDFPRPSMGSWVSLVVWLLVALVTAFMFKPWTQNRATELANQVHATMEPVNSYPDTDANHMVVVPEQVARRSASQAMSSQGASLASYYSPESPVLQSVKGHAYWIISLAPSSWKNSNRVHGSVPAYIVVDAEDPTADAVVRTADASGNKLHMEYQPDGYFSHKLGRYVWSHGYSGTPLSDWTLEVDDNWDPYWTASVDKLPMLFASTVPEGLVTVNAQSGAIQRYDFGKFPSWVDRIYSADTVKNMLNWWGSYGDPKKAPYKVWFRGSGGQFQVHGDPTLVYTKEGYPVWQVEMTSKNHDSSVAYMALFNGRDDTVRLYQIPDLAIESDVIDSIEKSGSTTKSFTPVHLALHKIYGHLTWVAPLVPKGDDDSGGTATWQGIALIPADKQLNGSDMVLSTSTNAMDDALANYQTLLANMGGTTKPGEDSTDVTVTGVVDNLSSSVGQGGNTVFYFTLKGDPRHDYRVQVQPSAQDSNAEIPFIAGGKKVRIAYQNTGSIVRDVDMYDDLGMKLGS
jgi:hypothetical protein